MDDAANPLSAGLAYVHHTGGTSRDWLARDAMFVVVSKGCVWAERDRGDAVSSAAGAST